MISALFSPSPPYVIEQDLQSRTYIFGQSSNVLVLDSSFEETRLVFANSSRDAGILSNVMYISASNQAFAIGRDEITYLELSGPSPSHGPLVRVPGGSLIADQFIFTDATGDTRKKLALRDFNTASDHQFAGLGYCNAILNYQVPIENAAHVFYAGFDSTHSLELARLQRTSYGTQLGIGTVPTTNALDVFGAAHVSSNLYVDGDLVVTGAIDASKLLGVPRLNEDTQKLTTDVLPTNVAYLNTENQIDASFLPSVYSGPYIRGLRNVGIGTRTPVAKLHVVGSIVNTERLGVGITNPSGRVHIYDNNVAGPALRVQKTEGESDVIVVTGSNERPLFNLTANGAVGIGTYNNTPGVRVEGLWQVSGELAFSNISTRAFDWRDGATGTAYLEQVSIIDSDAIASPALQTHVPFQTTERFITPEIRYGGRPADADANPQPPPLVRFRDSGIHVDLDAVFENNPIIVSDARVKSNITRIDNAIEALDHIRGYTFTKAPNPRTTAGFLAQEIEIAFPVAVAHLPDDRLAVQYDGILALLVEGFHELKAAVRKLQEQQEQNLTAM